MNNKRLSNRARDLIACANPNEHGGYSYTPADDPQPVCDALVALACLAAENPGLDWGNYQTNDHRASLAAYRSDARRAQQGLAECRKALASCRWMAVSDADVIDAARGDRAEVTRRADGRIAASYCAGQYYCTEYRHAIARVIERDAAIAYRRRADQERAA